MPKHKSRCRCCRDLLSDMGKRFDKDLGYVCPECHEFSAYAGKRLIRAGIEGSIIDPDRSSSTPETP